MRDISEFFDAGGLPKDRRFTLLELGAHVGMHTRYFLETFPLADVVIVEPDPRNIAEIKKHALHTRARLVEAAIADRDGEMTMHLSSGRRGAGGPPSTMENWTFSSSLKAPTRGHFRLAPWVKFQHQAVVPTRRLDTIARDLGLGGVEFIWCDIQGAEDLMIAGGQETLARTRYLYTEYSDEPLYEGQLPLAELHARLPGGVQAWEVVHDFGDDVLLRNRVVAAEASPRRG